MVLHILGFKKMKKTKYPRILHVLSGKGPGGTRTMFLHYQYALCHLGYPTMPCVRSGSYLLDTLKKQHTACAIMHYHRWGITPRVKKNLRAIYSQFHTEWILVHNAKDAKLWRCLVPNAFILLVLHEQNYTALGYVDAIFSVNSAMASMIQSQYTKPICILPNCIIEENISLPPLSIEKNTTLGYLGKIRHSKGIGLLLKALALLPSDTSWRLIVQGEGPLKLYYQCYAYLLGMHKKIIWRSWGATEPFFKDIDVLVCPSYKESFGLVLLESLTYNRPVISTETHGPHMILNTLGLKKYLTDITPHALSDALHQTLTTQKPLFHIEKEKIYQHYGRETFIKRLHMALTQTITPHYLIHRKKLSQDNPSCI